MKNKLIAITLLLISSISFAQEKIYSVWGFAIGSTQGTYFRAILDEANKQQTKYEFVFENKPGAGGAIAAQHVKNHASNSILAHSTAFFVRPYLYADNPYKFDQFKPLFVMGISPAALVTKGKTLDQLLSQDKINIATAGTGSTTHIMAEQFFKRWPNKNIQMIHYTNTNEAYKDVLGGHVDATFEFLGDVKAKGGTTIIGLTGKSKIDGLPLLKDVSPELEHIAGIFAVYVSKDMSADKMKELQQILLKAEKHESVQALYKSDYATKDAYMQTPADLTQWYNSTVKQFEKYTNGIVIK
ncbi:MAG: hypothetical protein RLY61_895 [Candidatus Parcubacteria bacterium]|jgi:tripartite-type tricarboxylate transporter receptor subunit TctC